MGEDLLWLVPAVSSEGRARCDVLMISVYKFIKLQTGAVDSIAKKKKNSWILHEGELHHQTWETTNAP